MNQLHLLQQQYEMVTGARRTMLNFIAQNLPSQLHTPVDAFNHKSLAYLLLHNADVYYHWLANFALKLNLPYTNENNYQHMNAINQLYTQVDAVVASFLNQYHEQLNQPVQGATASGKQMQFTPLLLFTQVTTHEFHHKGQLMTMCRLLGQAPPDTDVIRF